MNTQTNEMTIEVVTETIRGIVVEHLGMDNAEVQADTDFETLFAGGKLDSLDLVEIVMKIEDDLGIELDDARLGSMKPMTCAALAAYVKELKP